MTWAHDDCLTRMDVFYLHFDFLAAPNHSRFLGLQWKQTPYGFRCPLSSTKFKIAKEEVETHQPPGNRKKFGHTPGSTRCPIPIANAPHAPVERKTFALITRCRTAIIVFRSIGKPIQRRMTAAKCHGRIATFVIFRSGGRRSLR